MISLLCLETQRKAIAHARKAVSCNPATETKKLCRRIKTNKNRSSNTTTKTMKAALIWIPLQLSGVDVQWIGYVAVAVGFVSVGLLETEMTSCLVRRSAPPFLHA
jgi:hypothetical protein